MGERGAQLTTSDAPPRLMGSEKLVALTVPAGDEVDHWHQWVDACLGRGETTAHFGYSGPLTEVVLLGNVALQRPHETLRWNGPGLAFDGCPEADALLGCTYRSGWGAAP